MRKSERRNRYRRDRVDCGWWGLNHMTTTTETCFRAVALLALPKLLLLRILARILARIARKVSDGMERTLDHGTCCQEVLRRSCKKRMSIAVVDSAGLQSAAQPQSSARHCLHRIRSALYLDSTCSPTLPNWLLSLQLCVGVDFV